MWVIGRFSHIQPKGKHRIIMPAFEGAFSIPVWPLRNIFCILYQFILVQDFHHFFVRSRGWTRVLYSTKLKLFGWVPEFIISFLTGKALTEVLSNLICLHFFACCCFLFIYCCCYLDWIAVHWMGEEGVWGRGKETGSQWTDQAGQRSFSLVLVDGLQRRREPLSAASAGLVGMRQESHSRGGELLPVPSSEAASLMEASSRIQVRSLQNLTQLAY